MKKILMCGLMVLILSLVYVTSSFAVPSPPQFLDFINIASNYELLANGTYRYSYTLSAGPGYGTPGSGLSHWWLELPEHKIETLSGYNPAGPETYFREMRAPAGLYTILGDPFLGFHYGVKWGTEGVANPLIIYSFISTHSPVLDESGNVDTDAYSWFSKGGLYYDYGATLGPNGSIVPEPATFSLLGLGLLGLLARRKPRAR